MDARKEVESAFYAELARQRMQLAPGELEATRALFDFPRLQEIVEAAVQDVMGRRPGLPSAQRDFLMLRVEARHRTRLRRLARQYAELVAEQRRRQRRPLTEARLQIALAKLKCDMYPVCA